MTIQIHDRVQEKTTTTGTGRITLNGAVPGFRRFIDTVGNGNNTYYGIVDTINNDWEIGVGIVLQINGEYFLDRTATNTSFASNGQTLNNINLQGNICLVFIDVPAEKRVQIDSPIIGNADTEFRGSGAELTNIIPELPITAIGEPAPILNNSTNDTIISLDSGKNILISNSNGGPIFQVDSNGNPIVSSGLQPGTISNSKFGFDNFNNPVMYNQYGTRVFSYSNASGPVIGDDNWPLTTIITVPDGDPIPDPGAGTLHTNGVGLLSWTPPTVNLNVTHNETTLQNNALLYFMALSGSQSANVYLPNAAHLPYRTIKFIATFEQTHQNFTVNGTRILGKETREFTSNGIEWFTPKVETLSDDDYRMLKLFSFSNNYLNGNFTGKNLCFFTSTSPTDNPLTFQFKTSTGCVRLHYPNGTYLTFFESDPLNLLEFTNIYTAYDNEENCFAVEVVDSSGVSDPNGEIQLINLSGVGLTSFFGAGLTGLTDLNLSNNDLNNFNPGNLINLITLNLSGNNLISFDGTGPSNLTTLNLASNQIAVFAIPNLNNLQYLYLQSNRLTTFDGSMFNDLQILILEFNLIASFSGTGLNSLTNLNISRNGMTSFNAIGLVNLSILDLRINLLTSFNGLGLDNITQINLRNNQITTITNFSSLINLTSLQLQVNQLTSFSAIGLIALSTLNLSNNSLTSFNGTGLSNLTSLNLGINQLTSFTILSNQLGTNFRGNLFANGNLIGTTSLLNSLYTSLPTVTGSNSLNVGVWYSIEPGSVSIAINKGWSISE